MRQRGKRRLLSGLALLAGSYLYGSLPFVALLARRNGVDLRKVGTLTPGGSNLWQQVGPATGTLGWLLDASKGALPVIAARRLGLSPLVGSLSAVSGVAGQCWPITYDLDGGRGVSAILGASAMLAPRETAVMIVPMAGGCCLRLAPLLGRSNGKPFEERLRLGGANSRAVPLSVGLSILGIALLAVLRRRPSHVVLGTALNGVLLLTRRATANSKRYLAAEDRGRLLINRLLYDRDHVT